MQGLSVGWESRSSGQVLEGGLHLEGLDDLRGESETRGWEGRRQGV